MSSPWLRRPLFDVPGRRLPMTGGPATSRPGSRVFSATGFPQCIASPGSGPSLRTALVALARVNDRITKGNR